jgi:hypothetical protein
MRRASRAGRAQPRAGARRRRRHSTTSSSFTPRRV